MGRWLVVLLTLLSVVPRAAAGQALGVLHIKISLMDANKRATPVSDHALLISDNPSTVPPRRVVTGLDGTVDVRLRPGNYTVESDRPVAFQGKAYQWTQTIDVVAGRDAVLELTAVNADTGSVDSAATPALPGRVDSSSLLTEWQNSVVALWTPTAHASGSVVDARGLVATSQRAIGTTTSVEVQIASNVKVAARILAADSEKDVAVLWIDAAAVGSVRPVPLGCAQRKDSTLAVGQGITTIDTPLRQQKGTTSGTISRVDSRGIVADLVLASGAAGGPVFTEDGALAGMTSLVDRSAGQKDEGARVVPSGDVCDIVASAEKKMKDAARPSSAQLPVEPTQPLSVDALKEAALRRVGSLSPYQMASSDFDVAFMTPVLTYGSRFLSDQMSRRQRSGGARNRIELLPDVQPLMDFGNWSEYIADLPPVLLVRVTPKLVEGFWTKVARSAARTQGVGLPPLKHVKSGFLRMRTFCGDAEVTPIHPLKVEHWVSKNDAIYEGLYAFDPGAIGPHCGSVKLVLYSEKEPEKADTRVVDAAIVDQIWQDFASFRASK